MAEPTPQPTSGPEPKIEPQPQPQPAPAPAPEPKEPQPELAPEPQPQPTPEQKVEPQPEPAPEPKTETQPERKSEIQPEQASEHTPASKQVPETGHKAKNAALMIIVTALIVGLVGGLLGGFIFARPGPQGTHGVQGIQGEQGPQGIQGEQGPQGIQGTQGIQGLTGLQGVQGPQGYNGSQGIQGEQGPQGMQGEPGLNGTNAIQQILLSQNVTIRYLGSYNASQWYNMSVFDNSMHLAIEVNNQSRIYARFLSSVVTTNSAVMFRILVDNKYVSTVCYVGLMGSSSIYAYIPAQLDIVTGALSAGKHTIDVQFYRISGNPLLINRSLLVTELPLP